MPGRDRRTTCRLCRNFLDDPFELERQLPGLSALSSGLGASRGAAGLCRRQGVLQDPQPACSGFCPRCGVPLEPLPAPVR